MMKNPMPVSAHIHPMMSLIRTAPLSAVKQGVHSRVWRFDQAVSRRRVRSGVVLMSDIMGWMWVLTGIGFFILVIIVFVSQIKK